MVFAMLLVMNLFITGCQLTEDGIRIGLNTKTADRLEKGGEAGVSIAGILAPFFGPVGGIVAGSLASGLTLFKKFKPKLTKLQTKAEMSHTVASIAVETLETLKKDHPKIWNECIRKKVERELSKANIDTKVLENFIRALRGLPAKALQA